MGYICLKEISLFYGLLQSVGAIGTGQHPRQLEIRGVAHGVSRPTVRVVNEKWGDADRVAVIESPPGTGSVYCLPDWALGRRPLVGTNTWLAHQGEANGHNLLIVHTSRRPLSVQRARVYRDIMGDIYR